jgi:hypothetical protein
MNVQYKDTKELASFVPSLSVLRGVEEEFFQKLELAKKYGWIPGGIYEVEFTIENGTGQADELEYWPTSKRVTAQRKVVEIPVSKHAEFVFVALAAFKSTMKNK